MCVDLPALETGHCAPHLGAVSRAAMGAHRAGLAYPLRGGFVLKEVKSGYARGLERIHFVSTPKISFFIICVRETWGKKGDTTTGGYVDTWILDD